MIVKAGYTKGTALSRDALTFSLIWFHQTGICLFSIGLFCTSSNCGKAVSFCFLTHSERKTV